MKYELLCWLLCSCSLELSWVKQKPTGAYFMQATSAINQQRSLYGWIRIGLALQTWIRWRSFNEGMITFFFDSIPILRLDRNRDGRPPSTTIHWTKGSWGGGSWHWASVWRKKTEGLAASCGVGLVGSEKKSLPHKRRDALWCRVSFKCGDGFKLYSHSFFVCSSSLKLQRAFCPHLLKCQ